MTFKDAENKAWGWMARNGYRCCLDGSVIAPITTSSPLYGPVIADNMLAVYIHSTSQQSKEDRRVRKEASAAAASELEMRRAESNSLSQQKRMSVMQGGKPEPWCGHGRYNSGTCDSCKAEKKS